MLDLVTLAIEHALGALDGAGGVGGAGGVAGDVLEAGVWRGGTSIVAAATLAAHAGAARAGERERRVIVADSFAGIPSDSLVEWEQRYDVARATVEDNFARHGLLRVTRADGRASSHHVEGAPPVVFVEGFFNESLRRFAAADPSQRLAVLLSDADAYASTLDILEHVYQVSGPSGMKLRPLSLSQARVPARLARRLRARRRLPHPRVPRRRARVPARARHARAAAARAVRLRLRLPPHAARHAGPRRHARDAHRAARDVLAAAAARVGAPPFPAMTRPKPPNVPRVRRAAPRADEILINRKY